MDLHLLLSHCARDRILQLQRSRIYLMLNTAQRHCSNNCSLSLLPFLDWVHLCSWIKRVHFSVSDDFLFIVNNLSLIRLQILWTCTQSFLLYKPTDSDHYNQLHFHNMSTTLYYTITHQKANTIFISRYGPSILTHTTLPDVHICTLVHTRTPAHWQ